MVEPRVVYPDDNSVHSKEEPQQHKETGGHDPLTGEPSKKAQGGREGGRKVGR